MFLVYSRWNYTCPLCLKSIGDMTTYFQMIDSLLSNENRGWMKEMAKQRIHCNDCNLDSMVDYHYVYHKCPLCQSYNTKVI